METTSNMENQVINIVDLPDEILRDIFKVRSFKIPSLSDLSLVCKKFYEISCQAKFYEISAEMLLDDNSADLLKNSLKRFNSAYLSNDFLTSTDNEPVWLQKHIELLKLVGEDIKNIFLDIQIDSNLTSLLKLLPNLEVISLERNLRFKQDEPNSQTALNLPKLKEFEIRDYIGDVTMFNYLPNGVLRKIVIDYECSTTSELNIDFSQLFNNQRRLEDININSSLFPFIDFNALNFVKLAEFISNYETDNLEPIFHGLKSLETLILSIGSYISSEQAKSFANFQHLQTLSFNWSISLDHVDMYSDCLNGLLSGSLRNLYINIGDESLAVKTQTLKALSRNLPQLEDLRLQSKTPIEIINTIVGHFPNLEKLCFATNKDQYIFQENLNNERLNSLSIDNEGSLYMSQAFPKLLAACKNLEYFETTMQLNAEDIQAILILKPNLKNLSLQSYSPMVVSATLVAALGTFGPNLIEFSCNAVIFGDEITEDFVRKYLTHKFRKIKFSIFRNRNRLNLKV